MITIIESPRGRGEHVMGTETTRQENECFQTSPPQKFGVWGRREVGGGGGTKTYGRGGVGTLESETDQGPSRGGGWKNVVIIIAMRDCVVNYVLIISYPFMEVS